MKKPVRLVTTVTAELQLELPLAARRMPPRQQPVIERLRAVMRRSGINWRYRASNGSTLLRPVLGIRSGYEPMCGFFGCGGIVFERVDYCDRPPLTREERDEMHAYWHARREAVYELWGRP